MDTQQVKDAIIIPTLTRLNANIEKNIFGGQKSINMMLGTCAQESGMGQYIKQFPSGPALSIFQIEVKTHHMVLNWLKEKVDQPSASSIWEDITENLYLLMIPGILLDDQLVGNLYYATAIARLLYFSISEPLPEANDIPGLARYWKKYYNTPTGKGTEEGFINNYKKFIGT